jgi:nitrogen fixation-related uncharacterized protein
MSIDPAAPAGGMSRVLDTVDKGIEIGGGVLPVLSTPVAIAFIICVTITLLGVLATAVWWWRRHDKHEEDRNDLMRSLVDKTTQPPVSTPTDGLATIIGHFVEESAVTGRAMTDVIDRLADYQDRMAATQDRMATTQDGLIEKLAEYQTKLAVTQEELIKAVANLTERVIRHEESSPDCRACPRPEEAEPEPEIVDRAPRRRAAAKG